MFLYKKKPLSWKQLHLTWLVGITKKSWLKCKHCSLHIISQSITSSIVPLGLSDRLLIISPVCEIMQHSIRHSPVGSYPSGIVASRVQCAEQDPQRYASQETRRYRPSSHTHIPGPWGTVGENAVQFQLCSIAASANGSRVSPLIRSISAWRQGITHSCYDLKYQSVLSQNLHEVVLV